MPNKSRRFLLLTSLVLMLLLATVATARVSACYCPTPTPDPSPTPTPEPTEPPPAPSMKAATVPFVPVNMDTNVSFNDTDLGVTLLKSEDEQGRVQMDLFHTDTGTTTTTYLFSITANDIAPFIAEHPAANTLLASAEGVSVYVLTTGEIQVNAGPDAEGKVHVKIFDGIPWTHVYGYTIDPIH